jgi:hypothetical protein
MTTVAKQIVGRGDGFALAGGLPCQKPPVFRKVLVPKRA